LSPDLRTLCWLLPVNQRGVERAKNRGPDFGAIECSIEIFANDRLLSGPFRKAAIAPNIVLSAPSKTMPSGMPSRDTLVLQELAHPDGFANVAGRHKDSGIGFARTFVPEHATGCGPPPARTHL